MNRGALRYIYPYHKNVLTERIVIHSLKLILEDVESRNQFTEIWAVPTYLSELKIILNADHQYCVEVRKTLSGTLWFPISTLPQNSIPSKFLNLQRSRAHPNTPSTILKHMGVVYYPIVNSIIKKKETLQCVLACNTLKTNKTLKSPKWMQIQTDAYPLFPIAQESQQTAPPRRTTKRKVLPFFPQSTIEEKKMKITGAKKRLMHKIINTIKRKEKKRTQNNEKHIKTCEGLALDGRVELVTPSEAAGFAGATGDSSCDEAPVPGPELADESAEHGVFFRRPGPLDSVL